MRQRLAFGSRAGHVRIMKFLLVCALMILSAGAAASDRPNLIFILCDDLAQGDLGCYGQKLIQTPHLDRMAAEGTRFPQLYSGTSVCAPSRSSLMTGLHTGHCPIRANREVQPEGQKPLPEETITVAQVLKSAGYATACMGKWGMGMFDTSGSPLKKGFDHFYGYNCQRHAHSYFPKYLWNDDQRVELDGKTYAQDLIQDDVEKWVRSHAAKPFFLYYAITLPHGKFEIDEAQSKVRHYVEGSMIAYETGVTLTRSIKMDGGLLTLTTENRAATAAGATFNRLTWRKL